MKHNYLFASAGVITILIAVIVWLNAIQRLAKGDQWDIETLLVTIVFLFFFGAALKYYRPQYVVVIASLFAIPLGILIIH